jgi:hypothetical protein
VVTGASEVGRAATEELADRHRLSARRGAVARPLFHEPGTATLRALDVVYDLLELPPYHLRNAATNEAATLGARL